MKGSDQILTLTGNDIALAIEAASLAIAYYKKQPGSRSNWMRSRINAQKALIAKLSAINDYAYPYTPEDEPRDTGSEHILRLNSTIISKIHRAASLSKEREGV